MCIRHSLMIFQNNKRTISWLLIVVMFQLTLGTSGGAVMASSQMESEPMLVQSMQQACLDCEHQSQHALLQTATDCDDCQEKICLFSCSVCVQASLLTCMYAPLSTLGSEGFFHHISRKLTSLGYKPTPRPPKQHYS